MVDSRVLTSLTLCWCGLIIGLILCHGRHVGDLPEVGTDAGSAVVPDDGVGVRDSGAQRGTTTKQICRGARMSLS